MGNQVDAQRVRYIKLGEGGEWEEDCIKEGTLRIGFWTHDYFDLCKRGNWSKLTQRYEEEKSKTTATATRFVNEVRKVYEDDGRTLWITFHNRLMYWAFLDPAVKPWVSPDGDGTLRKTMHGWRFKDTKGNPLYMDSLSGNLTKTAAYRGTSCGVEEPDYVIRRVQGEQHQEVKEATDSAKALEEAISSLIAFLTPQDLELLVDLIFSTSGWRRLSPVGKTQKTVDMELQLPTTGERAFVQVKSATSQAEFEEYRDKLATMVGFDRMFYVYHTGTVAKDDKHEEKITLIGRSELGRMVLESGLVYWLIKKVG